MLNRKGISSIIGTLIFIGILFSAVAPMFIMMRQSDVFYEISKQEIEAEDTNKQQEDIIVYGYGEEEANSITVYVQNKGPTPIIVKRIWFNDEPIAALTSISPLRSTTIGPFNISDTSSDIDLKVSTSNGNVFSSDLGKLTYDEHMGWYTPSLGITVHILNYKGKYDIQVNNTSNIPIGEYTSTDTEDGDIDKTFLIGKTDSPCTVTVKKKDGGSWDTLLNQLSVTVPSSGNYIVHVVVDGR